MSLLVDAADGTIPFVKIFGCLVKLIQDQADASAKSDQYAKEAKKRAEAAAFQVS